MGMFQMKLDMGYGFDGNMSFRLTDVSPNVVLPNDGLSNAVLTTVVSPNARTTSMRAPRRVRFTRARTD